MKHLHVTISAVALAIFASAAVAQEVQITDGLRAISFEANGNSFQISRNQDLDAMLTGDFARIARPCPATCIQPIVPAAGVTPVAEIEVLTFLRDAVAGGTGLLLDARAPADFAFASIPAAANVPHQALEPTNPYQVEILMAFGATKTGDVLSFDQARDLVIYAGGPWDDQAATAIGYLLDAGYPAEKIHNYRGGMQDWLHFGLTTTP